MGLGLSLAVLAIPHLAFKDDALDLVGLGLRADPGCPAIRCLEGVAFWKGGDFETGGEEAEARIDRGAECAGGVPTHNSSLDSSSSTAA